jgi:hypothetical protein
LLYACFFLWFGGNSKEYGNIDDNPAQMMKIIEFLIQERKYPPAIFFKGLVKKYGRKVYSQVFPIEARALFLESQTLGVGAAAIELSHISKFIELDGIKSCQLGE